MQVDETTRDADERWQADEEEYRSQSGDDGYVEGLHEPLPSSRSSSVSQEFHSDVDSLYVKGKTSRPVSRQQHRPHNNMYKDRPQATAM